MTVSDAAEVTGQIVARILVVFGTVDGTMLATEQVRVTPTGRVKTIGSMSGVW